MDIKSSYEHAQVSVIGSMLISPRETAADIFHKVTPEYFDNPTYRNIFAAIKELFLERRPIDPVAIADSLGSGSYSSILAEIMLNTPTASNYNEYVEILVKGHNLTELQRIGLELTDCRDSENAAKLLSRAESIMTSRPNRRASTYSEMIHEYLDRQNDNTPPDYLDWGIPSLNRNLSISPGRFIVLGADSSVGKTALAFQLAYNVASKGKSVGFFSYETSRADAIDRILANSAGVDLPLSKHKSLGDGNFEAVIREGEHSSRIKLSVLETAGCTVEDLRAETLAGRFDVIFIDYVQLIPASSKGSRWEVVTEVSMELHAMAQQLGVTIIALSQVTPPETDRNDNRKMISKHNLRESRQLINDADAILMMDLLDPKNPESTRVLNIAKNKDGPLGMLFLNFDPIHMRFTVENAPKGNVHDEIRKAAKKANRERSKDPENYRQAEFEDLPDEATKNLPF